MSTPAQGNNIYTYNPFKYNNSIFSGYYTTPPIDVNTILALPNPQGQGAPSINPAILQALGLLNPPLTYQQQLQPQQQLETAVVDSGPGPVQLPSQTTEELLPRSSGKGQEPRKEEDTDEDSNSVITNIIHEFDKDIPPSKKRGRPPKNSAKSPPPKKKKNITLDFIESETTFDSIASDVVHRLGKPHKIPHHILLHLHLHMKENMLKLIKHTQAELNSTITNFANNSKLIMASIAHNYSDPENYPCLGSSSSSELFELVKKFETDIPSTPTP